MPKEDSKCICLSVIFINSVFRTDKNYYPQVFLEKCIYIVKKKNDEENSDKNNFDEEHSDEENFIE